MQVVRPIQNDNVGQAAPEQGRGGMQVVRAIKNDILGTSTFLVTDYEFPDEPDRLGSVDLLGNCRVEPLEAAKVLETGLTVRCALTTKGFEQKYEWQVPDNLTAHTHRQVRPVHAPLQAVNVTVTNPPPHIIKPPSANCRYGDKFMVFLRPDERDQEEQFNGRPRVCISVVPRELASPGEPAGWQTFLAAVLLVLTASSTVRASRLPLLRYSIAAGLLVLTASLTVRHPCSHW